MLPQRKIFNEGELGEMKRWEKISYALSVCECIIRMGALDAQPQIDNGMFFMIFVTEKKA